MKGGAGNEARDEFAFGRRLRRLREAAGLTQEELADRAGLSAKAISALERGARKRPYPHTVRSLADALELPEDERTSLLAAASGRGGGVADAAAPSSAPAGAAAPKPGLLQAPSTPLVGRERELAEVLEILLSGARLLTLTGTGGVGKTRLAARVAQDAAASFPDGVAFVALAPLEQHTLVVPTIAQALGVRETEGRTLHETLLDYLREKRLLLVLDNFEHVLEAAPEIAAMVEGARNLTVLATSRAPLRVRGEQEYPVQPLELPSSTTNPSLEEVVGSASGKLFVDRARAVSPGFELAGEDVAAVAAICWRLSGLPLALELAAAKARFMDPKGLLARLDAALSAGWARDVPERQRTMRATLDWSYELLSAPERMLFRRLSVFAVGFTLEAAEAVGATGGVGAEGLFDLLGSLVEQSLVTAEQQATGGIRYGMLEPVRKYGVWRLEENGEVEEARRRHAAFFLSLAERAEPELQGPRQVDRLDLLERENDNLRAAMSWALDPRGGETETAARLGWALYLFWWMRGRHGEGRRWMEALLERDLPDVLRAVALMVAAAMAYAQGDYETCERYSAECLELSRRSDDELRAAHARVGLGLVAVERADYEAATAHLEEALRLFQKLGAGLLPQVRVWLGTVLLIQGDYDRALPMFEEGLAMARQKGDRLGSYIALYNLAQVALARADHELATRVLSEAVALSEQTGDRANLAYSLEGLAVVAGRLGERKRSARLLGAAEVLLREVGAPVYNHYKPDRSLYEHTLAEARAELGKSAFEEEWARGQEMTFEQAVAFALSEATHGDSTPI